MAVSTRNVRYCWVGARSGAATPGCAACSPFRRCSSSCSWPRSRLSRWTGEPTVVAAGLLAPHQPAEELVQGEPDILGAGTARDQEHRAERGQATAPVGRHAVSREAGPAGEGEGARQV